MINDLRIPRVGTWKYVDDTTLAEVVPRGASSQVSHAVAVVEDWSRENKLQLNADKCKELVIDFKTTKHIFDPIIVDGKELCIVTNANILGITLSCNMQWNEHVSDIIKANKCLYFLVLLKQSQMRRPTNYIACYHLGTRRSITSGTTDFSACLV